jgi:hypothetical protein
MTELAVTELSAISKLNDNYRPESLSTSASKTALSLLASQDSSLLIELHVGYTSPLSAVSTQPSVHDEKENQKPSSSSFSPPTNFSSKVGGGKVENEIYFNFHFNIDSHEWIEVIGYHDIFELLKKVGPLTEGKIVQQLPVPESTDYQNLYLSLLGVNKKTACSDAAFTTTELTAHIKALERWMISLLLNSFHLEDESIQLIKQLFFRSEEKLGVFRRMVLKEEMLEEQQMKKGEN